MEFTEITKMEEFTSLETVNKYLALGWKVVNIYTTAYDTQYPGCVHQTTHYVLAWLGGVPQYPPKGPVYGTVL